jgi:hypothetical protein
MKFILLFTFLSCFFILNVTAQEIKVEYSPINSEDMEAAYADHISNLTRSFLFDEPEKSRLSGLGWGFVKLTKRADESKKWKERAMEKLEVYENQYLTQETYPETIIDGWHLAIITDNHRFCKQVKIFVKDNKIKKLVAENYIPIKVQAFTKIKNAKSIVNLEHFGREELVPVTAYFLFDIDKPNIVDEPQSPGFVCFWTSMKRDYDAIKIRVGNLKIPQFSSTFYKVTPPNCGDISTVYTILKPGRYSFIAEGRGSINWKKQFEVKSGECVLIELSK